MSEAAITIGKGIPVGNVIVDPGAIKGVGSWHNPYLCVPIKIQMYGRKEGEHVALIRLTASLHLTEIIVINNQFGDRVVYDLLFNMAHRSTVATKPAEGDVQLLFSLTHEQIKKLDDIRRMPASLLLSYDRLDTYSEQLRLVQAEVHRQVQEVQASVSTLVHSVVQAQTHALMTELQAVQAQMDRAVQSQFQQVYALAHSFTQHTPEQVQEHDAADEQGSGRVKRGSKRQANPSITLVHSVTDEQASEQGNGQSSEPLAQRIKQYILAQRRQGSEPSLAEIMQQCACSKGSAIRYRRELNGSHATGERSAVGQ